jgi:hypothetical protein
MSSETLYGTLYEWDERSIAVTHNIARRDLCLTHKWINASLYFGKGNIHISIEERHDDEHFGKKWGTGYGGIRFCEKCKLIDCIHFWEDQPPEDEAWKSCKHIWSGGLTRSYDNNGAEWGCNKCGASYRFMCGHGGSLYVCDPCYKKSIDNMINEAGTLEKYLSQHCNAPRRPVIRKCVHCEKRIRIL